MTRGSVIIPSVILVAGARALAMSASSLWAGILGCSGTSPAFTIAGTPKGTASLRAMPHRAAAAARPRRRIDRIRSATSEFVHKADVTVAVMNVRCWEKSRHSNIHCPRQHEPRPARHGDDDALSENSITQAQVDGSVACYRIRGFQRRVVSPATSAIH